MNGESEQTSLRDLQEKLVALRVLESPGIYWAWLPLGLAHILGRLSDSASQGSLALFSVTFGIVVGSLLYHYVTRSRVRQILNSHFPGWDTPPPEIINHCHCGHDLIEGEARCRFCGRETPLKDNSSQSS